MREVKIMEKQYTIQEVRNMICEFFDTRNPYKYLAKEEDVIVRAYYREIPA